MSTFASDVKLRPRSRSRSASPAAAPSSSSAALVQDPAQERALAADARFERAPPPVWKRAALLVFVALLFWTAVRMRMTVAAHTRVPEVEYAARSVAWVLGADSLTD
jgi:hypothetical protein